MSHGLNSGRKHLLSFNILLSLEDIMGNRNVSMCAIVYAYASFSQTHKVGNVGIIANFVFP